MFIVGDEKKLAAVATELSAHEAERIICVPVDATCAADNAVNFEIIIDPEDSSLVILRPLHADGNNDRTVEMQQIIAIGAVKFALRKEDDAWAEHVLVPPVEESPSLTATRTYRHKLAVVGGVLLLLGGIAAVSLACITHQDRQIMSLNDQINRSVSNYQIYAGRDKKKYILVDNERDYDWVLQSLVKMPPEFNVRVLTLSRVARKITRELNNQWPGIALRRLELSDDNQINLTISAEKSSLQAVQQDAIRTFIRRQLPWSEKIVFQRIQDRQIEQEADKALAIVPGHVEKIRLTGRLTYHIIGELDDAQLQRIKQRITGFNNVWGNSYVDFVISQKHDWLKDKSFKYGNEGYIKIKPGHWYFSKPLFQE